MKYIVFCFITFFLFSCGFLGSLSSNTSSSAATLTFLDSRAKEGSAGEFNSPAGRLESSSRCFDNKNCVEMCDSMLRKLAHQEKCYKKTENEVQALRDTYNLLALGNPEKLIEIEPEEMENFLEFGVELFQDTIYGFERQRKPGCKVESNPADPREREDCKLKNYYRQDGYFSPGASAALTWIARNNWLAELLLEYDEDHVIMLSLLDILAHGGGKNLGDDKKKETSTKREQTCNLALNEPDMDGNPRTACPASQSQDLDYDCERDTGEGTGPAVNLLTSDRNGDGNCATDNTKHGLFAIDDTDTQSSGKACTEDSLQQSEKTKNQYKALGAECLNISAGRRQTYMWIAVESENRASVNLGHQVVKDALCTGGNTGQNAKCVKYFHCFTYSSNDDRDKAKDYINGLGSNIKSWDSDTLDCLF